MIVLASSLKEVSSIDELHSNDSTSDEASEQTNVADDEVELSVKRLHSRHRRHIGPGTRWDWLVGWETVSDVLEIKVSALIQLALEICLKL